MLFQYSTKNNNKNKNSKGTQHQDTKNSIKYKDQITK